MNCAREICDLLQARASSGHSAFQLCRPLFDSTITILQQHLGINYQQAELLIINAMREHEEALYAALHDRVRLEDAEAAVRQCLGDDR